MKKTDVTAYSLEELQQKVLSEQENLRKMKFAHRISAIENPFRIKQIRRFIARLKTELSVKENQKQSK